MDYLIVFTGPHTHSGGREYTECGYQRSGNLGDLLTILPTTGHEPPTHKDNIHSQLCTHKLCDLTSLSFMFLKIRAILLRVVVRNKSANIWTVFDTRDNKCFLLLLPLQACACTYHCMQVHQVSSIFSVIIVRNQPNIQP